jgi:hypothetical protein
MAKASRVGLALSEETLTETALYEMALAHELDGKVAISLATKPQEAKHGGDWKYPVGAIADFAERTDRCRLYRWAGFWDATRRSTIWAQLIAAPGLGRDYPRRSGGRYGALEMGASSNGPCRVALHGAPKGLTMVLWNAATLQTPASFANTRRLSS